MLGICIYRRCYGVTNDDIFYVRGRYNVILLLLYTCVCVCWSRSCDKTTQRYFIMIYKIYIVYLLNTTFKSIRINYEFRRSIRMFITSKLKISKNNVLFDIHPLCAQKDYVICSIVNIILSLCCCGPPANSFVHLVLVVRVVFPVRFVCLFVSFVCLCDV